MTAICKRGTGLSLPSGRFFRMVGQIEEKVKSNHFAEMAIAREPDYYQKLIFDNLPFIEKQCRKVCSIYRKRSPPISPSTDDSFDISVQSIHMSCIAGVDADTLFNEVLDRLKADSYKVLRDFENRSKLTTYITTIIAHLVIDIKRKIDGRNRIKERAKALGPTGEKLYDLVFIKGYPAPEAYDSLQTTEKIKETFDEFQMIVEKIRGHQTSAPQQQPITKNTPEQDLISKQREELTKKVLNETLSELSNEERLLIRMKFPLSDDEEPKSLSEIGKMLHTTEKAVDSRIRRILTKLKEKMLRHGLSFDDFIDVFA